MYVLYFEYNTALRVITFQTELKSEVCNPFVFTFYQRWEQAITLQTSPIVLSFVYVRCIFSSQKLTTTVFCRSETAPLILTALRLETGPITFYYQ